MAIYEPTFQLGERVTASLYAYPWSFYSCVQISHLRVPFSHSMRRSEIPIFVMGAVGQLTFMRLRKCENKGSEEGLESGS